MAITNTDKTLSETRISRDGTLEVTLSVTAQPGGTACGDMDVALVLDRSGSMAGSPLEHLKAGAKDFIDLVLARGGAKDDGSDGSRVGIVSFAGTATTDVPLTSDSAALRRAVDALTAQGSTNHADGFTAGGALLNGSTRKKVLVIFTDGETTVGADPTAIAEKLRRHGVEIYCVGLVGRTGLDKATLCRWASEPADDHVITTPNAEELETVFRRLAGVIAGTSGAPGASDIRIRDTVHSDFRILGFTPPALGTAALDGAQAISWHIPTLAASAPETAALTFQVQHTGQTGGAKQVNRSIEFSNAAGETPTFPSPSVTVESGTVISPDSPHTVDVYAAPCQDSVFCDAGDVVLAHQGRILQVDFTLRNVCPHSRTCAAVIVTELMPSGVEESRGFKTLVLPAHDGDTCRDVHVMCVSFVLPNDPNNCGCERGSCGGRRLRVRVLANSMDSTWNGCGTIPIA